MSWTARRIVSLSVLFVVVLLFSGCLTLGPSVTADTSESPIFGTLSSDEPWAGQQVRVATTLQSTPEAGNVTTISVIAENGQAYSTVDVSSGQSTVILWVPANRNSTLVATNSVNSTTIGTLNVTSSGNRVI